MGRNPEESLESIFFLYLLIFCFANWSIWTHYQTIHGPTALATLISKEKDWHKNAYDYYLNIQFAPSGQKAATSRLEVQESYYAEFEPGDTFPIKYARSSPEDTAFVGEQFYATWAVVGYGVLVLILVFSGRGLYQKYRRSSGRRAAITSVFRLRAALTQPTRYSTAKTLAWAIVGALVFSSGIVSCRHSADFGTAPGETVAYQYEQATLLSAQYSAASNYPSALVRLPYTPATAAAVRVSLSPQQYALLHARLSRPNAKKLPLLVAYDPDTPNQLVVADAVLPPLAEAARETPLGISYNTLGMILCGIGVLLVASNLIKYVRHNEMSKNSW
ncbi:hypothetical protein HER32_13820 [Hymenobacter sp. BT18]|uniref:hypothetical protein n=1 Tax=Hymenobacter sp. BT18 TaxID=2835648 RepID=UPI00143EBA92|nr:hypothetical protein [Hymenobacter sp. BT18]QIX62197.1 hypothetical protein HER32_13820 [Hymenobacter sp. BT18]